MDYAEARHQLLLHGPGTTDADGQPLSLDDGFIDSLRPYSGLHERNFHLVMEALLTVGEQLHQDPHPDRELVHAIWWICSMARAWGLAPGGMLQRNRLITANDTARLERWVNTVEDVGLRLLGGSPPYRVVYCYAWYVAEMEWWDNAAFFVDLMSRTVADPDEGGAIEDITRALSKLGARATAALPALREAERREYTWYMPVERCTEETRAQLRHAIQAIEG